MLRLPPVAQTIFIAARGLELSLLWLLAAVVLLVAALLGWRPLDIWFTACLAGVALGGMGYGIYTWQRAAARRGSRGAQPGLD